MKHFTSALAALAILGAAAVAAASPITMTYSGTFSNDTVPGGPAPWLTATFDDLTAGAGQDVRLTLNSNGLIPSEFIGSLYFNLNPAYDPLGPDAIALTTVSDPLNAFSSIQTGTNAFKADGDGLYDVLLDFNTSACCRFTADQTLVFDLNLLGGLLLPTDFAFLSAPAGGSGPFYSAAHLQGIATGEGSTWLSGAPGGFPPPPPPPPAPIPEPTSLVLLGSGLFLAVRRLKTRKP